MISLMKSLGTRSAPFVFSKLQFLSIAIIRPPALFLYVPHFHSLAPFWSRRKSVGLAAMQMVYEVQRQFAANPKLLLEDTDERPDYTACVAISTKAALSEMIAPGALVIFAPLITGTLFGERPVWRWGLFRRLFSVSD